MRDTEREAEGEGGFPQGARCGTQFQDPGITPWAKGRFSTTKPPTCPSHHFNYGVTSFFPEFPQSVKHCNPSGWRNPVHPFILLSLIGKIIDLCLIIIWEYFYLIFDFQLAFSKIILLCSIVFSFKKSAFSCKIAPFKANVFLLSFLGSV